MGAGDVPVYLVPDGRVLKKGAPGGGGGGRERVVVRGGGRVIGSRRVARGALDYEFSAELGVVGPLGGQGGRPVGGGGREDAEEEL